LPVPKTNTTKWNQLFNEILKTLNEMNCGWFDGCELTIGLKFLENLTALIWYLDAHHSKFEARGLAFPNFIKNLPPYINGQYYKEDSHYKKSMIESYKLEIHIQSVQKCLEQPWASNQNWRPFILQVFHLTNIAQKYLEYLKNVKQSVTVTQNAMQPARNSADNSKIEFISHCQPGEVRFEYQELVQRIKTSDIYEVIPINEYLPSNKYKRYQFFANLSLDSPIMLYCYYHRNYLGTLNFAWRIPININDRSDNQQAYAIIKVQDNIPHYFTRGMKRDASSSENLPTQEMENRLKTMLELSDPDIVVDLRVNNGFKGNKFDFFWNELKLYFEE
ncbi:14089_t:CDS:2, partial [Racocetra fulgida]